ncbi:Ig domain-containing protein, partial [Amycolatopsis vastitatis]
AGAGWDGPTGLGTPNGTAAFTAGTSTGGVTVANPGSQSGVVGTAASLQLSASGGSGGYTWTATGLPAGLAISTSGLISGTPATAGTYSVTATAKDSSGATGSTTFSWTVTSSGGSGCSGQKLANPGFESGATSWTASSGVITTASGSETPHSGSYLAYLDGYGSSHTDTLSQQVTIPAGCHASLSYYLHVDTAETTTTTQYDKLTVKAGSTTLATYSNLNKGTGYQQRTADVSAFAGQTVTLTFTGTEDSSLQTSFCLDDTALTLS